MQTTTTSTSDEKTQEGESSSDAETLYILGAVYGLADVTEDVKQMVTDNQLVVYASNKVFGDGWPNVKKTLVVVYKYGADAYEAGVAFVEEDKKLIITRNTDKWYFHEFNLRPNKLTIFGAVYGLEDVTTKSRNLVSRNELIANVHNKTFGDTWPNVKKALVVVYGYGTNSMTSRVAYAGEWEGTEELEITPSSKWTLHEALFVEEKCNLIILGAAYGLANVTDKVKRLIENNRLAVSASNQIFGDSWYGVIKTLVVVYKYGENATSVGVAIVDENKQMVISRNSRDWTYHDCKLQSGTFTILGAVYGLADVTTKARALLSDDQYTIAASNKVFGDPWFGVRKTLVVVYTSDGSTTISTSVAQEDSQITLPSTCQKKKGKN